MSCKNNKSPNTCKITGSSTCRCDKNTHKSTSSDDQDLKSLMRKLFTDHAVYTKAYVECVLNNTPDDKSIGARLFANQDEIGTNVGKIIGAEKGDKLATLLKEHIKLAGVVVVAAKKGTDITEPKKQLFDNSSRVSAFLSALNPKVLPYLVVKTHFDQHNTYVIEMVVLHLGKKFEEEIKVYDKYYNHMLMFSDFLSSALKKPQEPKTLSLQTNTYSVSHSGNMDMFFYLLVVLLLIIILYHVRRD